MYQHDVTKRNQSRISYTMDVLNITKFNLLLKVQLKYGMTWFRLSMLHRFLCNILTKFLELKKIFKKNNVDKYE